MEPWKRSIRCAINDEFITPFPPQEKVATEIRLKMIHTAPVIRVVCHAILDGNSHYFPMREYQEGKKKVFTGSVPPSNERKWYFSFQIETSEGWFFATRKGILPFHPSLSIMWSIDTGLESDDWVPGSTFYQIFPDRFRNGNRTIGVRTDEYEFDGHRTKELSQDEIPPTYQDGWCLDFYNGDLKGIAQSIDHLLDMGITAVYLNPIFSAKTNHRYDCIDFFHVDEHLGGDEALAMLSKRLHEVGIRLMVDISINHSGVEHPWFKKAKEDPQSPEADFYYRDGAENFVFWEDVHTLPQLNYSSEKLRQIMYRGKDSVIRKFLRPPFSIDAWRFDVGTDTGRRGEDQFCHQIWREVRKAIKEESRQTYIIGEAWEDASSYIQGDQWDSAMNYFGSGRLLRRWYGQQDTYLMSNWGHSDESGRPLTGRELSDAIAQHLLSIPEQLVHRQFNLLDSHDTMRLHNHKRIFDWGLYEGIVMLLFVLPGVPNVYYGDEIGIDGTIESNEGARYPMRWDKRVWDQRFVDLYGRLGKMRKDSPLFAYGDWKTIWYDDTTVVFSRVYREEGLLMVLNRSDLAKTVSLDLQDMVISTIREWESEEEVPMDNGHFTWNVNPHKSHLFLFRTY